MSLTERFGRSALQRVASRRAALAAEPSGDAPAALDAPAAPAPIQPSSTTAVVRHRSRPAPLPAVDPTGPIAGAVRPFMPAIPDNMLKSVLDVQDKAAQASRIGVPGYTHISTLTHGVCSRHYAINAIHDKKDWESATGGHQLMWKYGRAAEAHIRTQITRAAENTKLRFNMWGDWKCPCEHTVHTGTKPKDMRCTRCQRSVKIFHEHPLYDHANRIVGNCDLPAMIGRYFMPYEFKSMNAKEWDLLEAPLAAHIMQCLGYRHLFATEGYLVHDKIGFIYAAKEFKFGSPYKEFHIDATEARYVQMLGMMLEQAQDIARSLGSGVIPARDALCISCDAPKARKCPRVSLCFNLPT